MSAEAGSAGVQSGGQEEASDGGDSEASAACGVLMNRLQAFERDVNNFLLDNCVGADDHGPGLGPLPTEDNPIPCLKCTDMKKRLMRLCELHGFISGWGS